MQHSFRQDFPRRGLHAVFLSRQTERVRLISLLHVSLLKLADPRYHQYLVAFAFCCCYADGRYQGLHSPPRLQRATEGDNSDPEKDEY